MANYGGQNFTTFVGVNAKGTVALRAELDGGFAGTLSVKPSVDTNRAWQLPDKSGTLPIMGTFSVQLPATSTSQTLFSTIITVAGIRVEDALTVQPNRGASAGYSFSGAGGTVRTLVAAEPGNGQITLTFLNIGTTGYVDQVYSYLASR